MGQIYLITNLINNKQYVGQTKYTALKRFKGHIGSSKNAKGFRSLLDRSIAKYGADNFNVEVLECDVPESELDEQEIKYIAKYNTLTPNGYNLQIGGQANGRTHTLESRENMRQAKLGSKNHNYGKPRDDETKRKISLAKAGENHHYYGKTFSEEHKLKLAKAHRKEDDGLPMYLVKIRPRPGHSGVGYAVMNHPKARNKYFTSIKISDDDKLAAALAYLEACNEL